MRWLCLLLLGCSAADSRPVDITFRAENFACGAGGKDFRFYVSNVRVVTDGGDEHPLALDDDGRWQGEGVAMIDFTDGACPNTSDDQNVTLRGTGPDAAIAGLRFTIGVPEALNHRDLATVPAPLDDTTLWWTWNYGHIFLAAASDTQLVHVGATGCSGDAENGEDVTCAKGNRIEVTLPFDPENQVVVADFAAVFTGAQADVTCHSFTPGDACVAPFARLGLDFVSGDRLPAGQQVFRAAAK
jgi:uncharacterized repeat protein (TIGR04052 family)